MRHTIVYWFLLLLKRFGRLFYSYDGQWVGQMGNDPWRDEFRLVAILNHTSLFEFLFAGIVPDRFLRHMACHGVVPIAAKTLDRPLIGFFWRLVAGNVVSVSRERDETWKEVIDSVDPRSMVIILPEGRMKRKNGLDSRGKPLVVRTGIADLIETIPEGKLLLAYSQGLHHIQIPDHDRFPRLFRPVRMRFEILDIADYRREIQNQANGSSFRARVTCDLTARRNAYCTSDRGEATEPGSPAPAPAAAPSPEAA